MAELSNIPKGPPNLQSSVQRARHFYRRCNAMPLYDHVHRVFRRSVQSKIVEGEAIANFAIEPERAWMNSIIAEVDLYHVLARSVIPQLREGTARLGFELPEDHPLRSKAVLHEMETFCRLTALDRQGASREDYEKILNNGQAPLALLARLADYAVTHDTEDRTPQHVDLSGNLFRMYDNMAHAEACLKMDAMAGEQYYAPIAELFGYPSLAGDIIRHAYRINHPMVHAHVIDLYEDGQALENLHLTQNIARRMKKRISRMLKEAGFDARIVPRMKKNRGKVMRKFYREIQGQHGKLDERTRPPLHGFIEQTIPNYDLTSINDPVALKVVLERFQGREIDGMPEKEMKKVIALARGIVMINLGLLELSEGYKYKHTFVVKDNGYKAHHYDARPGQPNGKLPIEIQVKTKEWDDIASHGKAAHYYYIGGDSKFIDMIAKAYHKIIYRTYGNGR
jgi:hypothetical protein